jgi:uncharacterized protein YhbP (UPF0306 family)
MKEYKILTMQTLITALPHQKITDFMQAQTVMTIAVITPDNKPVCASCFYVYDSENALIIFKSETATHHIEYGLLQSAVGGSILPDTLIKTQIKGIQFEGKLLPHANSYLAHAKQLYYLKYPFAAVMAGHIWVIQLNSLKFTDNSLGFGKKLLWQQETI